MPNESTASFPSKLRAAASGGFVIGAFLLAWASLPLAGADKAAKALEEFRRAVASPEPLILVPVVMALFACLALSWNGPIDAFSRWLLRPALGFCSDFCVTAAGAVLPFGLLGVRSEPGRVLGYTVLVFVVVAGAGWMFHHAFDVSRQMSDRALPDVRRAAINWIGFAGLFACGLIAYFS